MLRIFFATVLLFSALCVDASNLSTLIPRPERVEKRSGVFTILTTTKITHSAELRSSANYLAEYLPLDVLEDNGKIEGNIVLRENKNLAEEAYTLDVSDKGIVIEGGASAGVVYGIETLLQMLPVKIYTKQVELPLSVSACRVEDEPYFSYRGFMLDVSRTWVDAEGVKKFIENLAHHKIQYYLKNTEKRRKLWKIK